MGLGKKCPLGQPGERTEGQSCRAGSWEEKRAGRWGSVLSAACQWPGRNGGIRGSHGRALEHAASPSPAHCSSEVPHAEKMFCDPLHPAVRGGGRGGGEQGSQPPPLLPPGPGRCGARPAKPSPALPGARRGQAGAEEGRAGLFYAPPPPEPRTERSGEEREGGPAPPVLPSPHTWLPRHSSQLCPAAGCSSCARGTDGAGRWGGGGEGEGAVGGRVQSEGGYRGRGAAGQGLVGGSRAAM